MKKPITWSLLVFAALTLSSTARTQVTFTDAVIDGSYKCNLTAYSLPSKGSSPFAVTALGNIDVTADGKGKLTSGTWTHIIDAPDLHATCNLTMVSGKYSISANGSGSQDVEWQLIKSTSSPNCLMFWPDDAAKNSAVPSDLIVRDPSGRMFYTSSINPFAVLATACQRGETPARLMPLQSSSLQSPSSSPAAARRSADTPT